VPVARVESAWRAFLAQRAAAAFLAISLRFLSLRFSIRLAPLIFPPFEPSAAMYAQMSGVALGG